MVHIHAFKSILNICSMVNLDSGYAVRINRAIRVRLNNNKLYECNTCLSAIAERLTPRAHRTQRPNSGVPGRPCTTHHADRTCIIHNISNGMAGIVIGVRASKRTARAEHNALAVIEIVRDWELITKELALPCLTSTILTES